HVAAPAVGNAGLPTRHSRARQPFIYGSEQVGIDRELSAWRRTDLIDRAGEIAGRRDHVLGSRAVAGTIVSMTSRTPLHIDGLPGGRVLGSYQRNQKQCVDHLLPSALTSHVRGFQPV